MSSVNDNKSNGNTPKFKLIDENGKVVCQECGKSFCSVTHNHLKKQHKMSVDDYKEKYPGVYLTYIQYLRDMTKEKLIIEKRKENLIPNNLESFEDNNEDLDNKPKEEIFNKVEDYIEEIDGDEFEEEIDNEPFSSLRPSNMRGLSSVLISTSPDEIPSYKTEEDLEEIFHKVKRFLPSLQIQHTIRVRDENKNVLFEAMADMADEVNKIAIFLPSNWTTLGNTYKFVLHRYKTNLKNKDWIVISVPDVLGIQGGVREIIDYIEKTYKLEIEQRVFINH